MRSRIALVAVAGVVGFGAGSLATAATPWRPIAVDENTGESHVGANVYSSAIQRPKALAVRLAGGQAANVSWYFTCSTREKLLVPGRVWVVSVATAEACGVSASANRAEGGKIRLQLLRK